MKNYIWVTTRKEIIHNYPDAPKEVEYLRNPHRHIAHIKVYLEIFSDNRDVEFIRFKHEIEDMIKIVDIGTLSCEMLANYLGSKIKQNYPNRHIMIEISEDGENGILKSYDEG